MEQCVWNVEQTYVPMIVSCSYQVWVYCTYARALVWTKLPRWMARKISSVSQFVQWPLPKVHQSLAPRLSFKYWVLYFTHHSPNFYGVQKSRIWSQFFGRICWVINNSVADCQILLKFVTFVHYRSAGATQVEIHLPCNPRWQMAPKLEIVNYLSCGLLGFAETWIVGALYVHRGCGVVLEFVGWSIMDL